MATIEQLEVKRDTFEARITRGPSGFPRLAPKVIRAWGSHLFKGATFTITFSDGSTTQATWAQLSELFS